jgi:hypothetical protein
MAQTILIEHKEATRPEQCRTLNNRYLLVLANHNLYNIKIKEIKRMRGWGWIPIHLPFSPSSLILTILQTFHLPSLFTI